MVHNRLQNTAFNKMFVIIDNSPYGDELNIRSFINLPLPMGIVKAD